MKLRIPVRPGRRSWLRSPRLGRYAPHVIRRSQHAGRFEMRVARKSYHCTRPPFVPHYPKSLCYCYGTADTSSGHLRIDRHRMILVPIICCPWASGRTLVFALRWGAHFFSILHSITPTLPTLHLHLSPEMI